MDVRCEQCQTVYEFDEARVKDAGVTVKCTQCGHIFKVRKRAPDRPRRETLPGYGSHGDRDGDDITPAAVPQPIQDRRAAQDAARDSGEGRWMLRSAADGSVRRFRDLNQLQLWVTERRVSPSDEISRTGDTWKRLAAVAELRPLFQARPDDRAPGEPDPAYFDDPGARPTAFGPRDAIARTPSGEQSAWSNVDFDDDSATRPVHRSDIEDLDRIPRRGPRPIHLAIGAAVLLVVAAGGYVGVYKRSWLRGAPAQGRGTDAYRKGLEHLLGDGDENFRLADESFQRARGADEGSPLPVAGLVSENVTWARALRDDAARVEKSEPGRAAELRRMAQAHLDDARRYAGEAQSLGPDAPEVNLAMADLLCLDGAPAAQVDDYLGRSAAKRPDAPELAYVRGVLLLREGKRDEARARLDEANRLGQQASHQDLLRADLLLAQLAIAENRPGDARTLLQRMLAANPQHERARSLLALVEPPAAPTGPAPAGTTPAGAPTTTPLPAPAGTPAPAPTAAVTPPAGNTHASPEREPQRENDDADRPARADAHGYDGEVAAGNRLLEYGKSREALKLFEKALAERPDGVDALLGVGYADLDTEHFNAAADHFRRVLELAPGNGEAIIGLAQTYKLRGDKTRALEYYQRYLRELPTGSKAAMAETNVKALQSELPGRSEGRPEGKPEGKPESRDGKPESRDGKPEGSTEARPILLPAPPNAPTEAPPPP